MGIIIGAVVGGVASGTHGFSGKWDWNAAIEGMIKGAVMGGIGGAFGTALMPIGNAAISAMGIANPLIGTMIANGISGALTSGTMYSIMSANSGWTWEGMFEAMGIGFGIGVAYGATDYAFSGRWSGGIDEAEFNKVTSQVANGETNGELGPILKEGHGYSISQGGGFGSRIHPVTGESGFHKGIDISCPSGSTVINPIKGGAKVLSASWSDKGGNMVNISNGKWGFKFAHLQQMSVSAGQHLDFGAQIGLTGNTGSYTTGAHLHMEMYYNGGVINPTGYYYLFRR